MEMMDDEEIDCAVETLARAEEIKNDPELMAEVLKRAKEKQAVFKSISGLRKYASKVLSKDESGSSDYGDDPELRTEEDKAALQESNRVDGKLKEMGMDQKGK